jgi:hypothetical protein
VPLPNCYQFLVGESPEFGRIAEAEKDIAMSISINFSPEVEAALAKRAEIVGRDIPSLVQEFVAERLADDVSKPVRKLSAKDFMARLETIANRHPGVSTFVDDSRESIYAGRGE